MRVRPPRPTGASRATGRLRLLVALGMLGGPPPLAAHEVAAVVRAGEALVVQLRYPDGEPFAFESYELFAGDSPRPRQTGRTDAEGRVVFLADGDQAWRLRASSADGHGVELRDLRGRSAAAPADADCAPGRAERALIGLAALAGLFAALRVLLRRTPPPTA